MSRVTYRYGDARQRSVIIPWGISGVGKTGYANTDTPMHFCRQRPTLMARIESIRLSAAVKRRAEGDVSQ